MIADGFAAWLPSPGGEFSKWLAEGNRIRWETIEVSERLGCSFWLAHRLVLKHRGLLTYHHAYAAYVPPYARERLP